MKRTTWGLVLCAAAVWAPWGTRADTITVPAVADTFITASSPDFNAGAHAWFDTGTDGLGGVRRGLLRFDLSSVPVGATITSAVVRLTVVRVPSQLPVNSTFDLFRLNAAWGEGNKAPGTNAGSGALAGPGEATWNARLQGTATWTTPGAAGDAAVTASGSADVGAASGAVYAWSDAGVLSDVQAWAANPAQNFGWLLRSQAETSNRSVRGFASREDPDGRGPVLEVGYTPGQNLAPVVSLTNPTNGTTYDQTASVTLQATASDADGSVAKVEFFDGSNSLGIAAASPYEVAVTLYPGNHTLTAVATDNAGASTTSLPVMVSVGTVTIPNPIAARIPLGNIVVELQTVAGGLASPVGMAVPDDGSGRSFVYDQDGQVWILAGGARQSAPLLDLRSRLVLQGAYDERGLLGLAVHPNFAQHPLLYTYTSEPYNGVADFQNGLGSGNDHQSVIAEWRISTTDSNAVDVATRREIARIDEPQSNHNGGAMHFGPDGFLYIALGDGGQAADLGSGHAVGGNAQDLGRIWGKLIRIDVDGTNSVNGRYGVPDSNPFVGTNAVPELFAYGLRNPFAFSFDRQTKQLYLADVGQNRVEEVDIITAGGNYGWNLKEGGFWFDPSTMNDVTAPVRPPPPGLIDPIAQYDHDDGSAVIGGYVYRGTAIPALVGHYVFGDWGSFGSPSGRLFYLDDTNGVNELRLGTEDRALNLWIRGFGQDADGELYLMGSRWLGPSGNTGRILKIVPPSSPINVTGILSADGTNLTATWSGGAGPFAVQKKVALSDPVWANVAVVDQPAATLPIDRPAGFFRVGDAAHVPPIPFTVYMTGAAERPATNSSAGLGTGIFVLDGNTLTFNVQYGGLSGAAFAAHIHGPSTAAGSGPVMIDLSPYNGGAWGTSGTLSGVIVLTDIQKALVLAGQTYVNLHTPSFTEGEIRGQIAPVNMQVALSGNNESPVVATSGSGLGNLTLVGNQLTFNLTYQGLSGIATASHIHGPASTTQNAGVLIGLTALNGGAYGTAGSLSGTVTLSPDQLAWVVDGLTYVNFHTPLHGGGEIRGQILPHSTGVPFTALLSGLAERPTPLTNTAAGNGTFSLEGDVLTLNLVYSGLSGSAMGAQLHGPASSGTTAPILINLAPLNGGSFGTAGTLSGSVLLTPVQRNALLAGRTYVNFYTSSNPDGEMRGQIAPVAMTASLSGHNENPAVATSGSGSGTFALVRDQLALQVTYSGLLGTATASHIHGPAGLTGNAGVLVNLAPYNGGAYGASGSLGGVAPLPLGTLLPLIDGQTYVNFHTPINSGGEIRGQIMP